MPELTLHNMEADKKYQNIPRISLYQKQIQNNITWSSGVPPYRGDYFKWKSLSKERFIRGKLQFNKLTELNNAVHQLQVEFGKSACRLIHTPHRDRHITLSGESIQYQVKHIKWKYLQPSHHAHKKLDISVGRACILHQHLRGTS